MLAVTFDSETAYLLDDEPNWNESVSLTAALPAELEAGLTAREARRPLGDTLRLALRYTVVLQGSAVPLFRNGLQVMGGERVLCPLWPALTAIGGTPPVTAPWYVLLGDGATAVITDDSPPFARPCCPLLVGRLAETPDPEPLHDEAAIVAINFVEDDAFPIVLAAYTPPAGPAAAGTARPLFPIRPNWGALKSGGADAEVDRQSIGQGRQMASAFYGAPGLRRAEMEFVLQSSEPWQLLRFFLDCGGAAANFWAPAGLSDTRLTHDVLLTDTHLTVGVPANRGSNIAYLLDDLVVRTAVKIDTVAGSDWNLTAAVGRAYTAARTTLQPLVLSRFQAGEITLEFDSLERALLQARFREVAETVTISGETIGTTLGALAKLAYLFEFSIAYPGATTYYRFTSFERSLSYDGEPWATQPIEFGSIEEADTLDATQVDLKSRHFSGNPLSLLVPLRLEWPLRLRILECTVESGDAAGNVACIFNGLVGKGDFDGPFISATCTPLGRLFDRKIPRRALQQGCNWTFFDAGCGVDRDDHGWQATVVNYWSSTLELVMVNPLPVSPNPGYTTEVDHLFAGGYLRKGSGATGEWRMIADSSFIHDVSMTLVVATPFVTAPEVDDTIYFWPGCDRRWNTCAGRWNNYANFGGFPFIPIGNPTNAQVRKSTSSGGKK